MRDIEAIDRMLAEANRIVDKAIAQSREIEEIIGLDYPHHDPIGDAVWDILVERATEYRPTTSTSIGTVEWVFSGPGWRVLHRMF